MQNAVLRNLSLVVCQGPLPVVSVHDADYSADGVFIYYFTQVYVFDVEDEYAESDIPTTLIRSKADCPGIEVSYFLTVLLFVFACVVLKHLRPLSLKSIQIRCSFLMMSCKLLVCANCHVF